MVTEMMGDGKKPNRRQEDNLKIGNRRTLLQSGSWETKGRCRITGTSGLEFTRKVRNAKGAIGRKTEATKEVRLMMQCHLEPGERWRTCSSFLQLYHLQPMTPISWPQPNLDDTGAVRSAPVAVKSRAIVRKWIWVQAVREVAPCLSDTLDFRWASMPLAIAPHCNLAPLLPSTWNNYD